MYWNFVCDWRRHKEPVTIRTSYSKYVLQAATIFSEHVCEKKLLKFYILVDIE
jgi:hypothetical protein